MSDFDAISTRYEEELNKGLSISGESKDFFLTERLRITGEFLARQNFQPQSILDFGCGTGESFREIKKRFHPKTILGVDASAESLKVASNSHADVRLSLNLENLNQEKHKVDLVYTNGTFHHIPPLERAKHLQEISKLLNKGGCLALWENNPWSPPARFVMSRIPFDKEAVMVWPHQIRRQLTAAGFEVQSTGYWFVFPSFLKSFRSLEPSLSHIALGAQYLILAKK